MRTIECHSVTKEFQMFNNSKEKLLNLFFGNKHGQNFKALREVDFIAKQGEVVGFVGINGSGKSTLARIIANITPPTRGKVKVSGEVSLIAVSAGLNNNLTGRNNIKMKCLMLGFSWKKIQKIEEEIIRFSELDEFIDQPVKFYSSGMKSRLGFSIAICVNPDILIVDEALSVGDNAFAEKCLKKMYEFKQQGKTMIFVSHSINQMRLFCDRILWLEFGQVKMNGKTEYVLEKYEKFLNSWANISEEEKTEYSQFAKSYNINNENYPVLAEKIEDFEKNVSRLGILNTIDGYIYKNYFNLDEYISIADLFGYVYYVEKMKGYENTIYFLLYSDKGEELGWIKASNIDTYAYSLDRNVNKVIILSKESEFFTQPLGQVNNFKPKHQIQDNMKFLTRRMMKVNGEVWYQIKLENEYLWVNSIYILEEMQ